MDPETDPVPRECVANLDSVESLPMDMLVQRIGRLSDSRMHEMCTALGVAVDCA